MLPSEISCYHKECDKMFQSKAYLITHINTCHLDVKLYRCTDCEIIFNSSEKYFAHKKKPKSNTLLNQSQAWDSLNQCICQAKIEYIPPNILKLPVLPPIESERKYLAYQYKLSMTPSLYDLLCKGGDSQIS
jgi:uncharacterized C2H2 Zn-finger protein